MIKRAFLAAVIAIAATNVNAGGLLTNTNQNVAFLRNPARDAAIGIDGVYSNPAGVAFMPEGWHMSLTLQNVKQTRTIETESPLFMGNALNPSTKHTFEGEASAPVVPSLQIAKNVGKWSFQFNFAITGGGGKCTFDNGLGSFEQLVGGTVAQYAPQINQLYQMTGQQMVMGSKYNYEAYMRGRQYYYGFTLGAAYKVNDNLSVYGGVRMLYGTANYFGYLKNIQVEQGGNMVNSSQYFTDLSQQLSTQAGVLTSQAAQAEAAGMTAVAAQAKAAAAQLTGAAGQVGMLAAGTNDITLNCDQTGFGFAPIIGVDYKIGNLNLATKYEFKTRMRLENQAANSESANNVALLDNYKDGKTVAEDSPALLTVGAEYAITPSVRVSAGWHHYFDVDTKQYTKAMLSDTNEYLLGAEWDINDMITVSAGGQRTQYGLKDEAMSDVSFNVNSYSYGLGVAVKVAEGVKINAAFFQTLYDDYTKTTQIAKETFTRENRVIGLGVDWSF